MNIDTLLKAAKDWQANPDLTRLSDTAHELGLPSPSAGVICGWLVGTSAVKKGNLEDEIRALERASTDLSTLELKDFVVLEPLVMLAIIHREDEIYGCLVSLLEAWNRFRESSA
jgi:hypothetical protein